MKHPETIQVKRYPHSTKHGRRVLRIEWREGSYRMPVDVIIPVYHRADVAERTLHDVLDTTDARVFLVDDCDGERDTKKLMQQAGHNPRVVMVRMHKNGGWTGATRAAVNMSDSEWFVLLNSDCSPASDRWLDTMMANASRPEVGIVGALLLYPNGHRLAGSIQHAGVARIPNGQPYHIFKYHEGDYPPALVRRDVNAVTGACMLIRRGCWDALGGWSPEYGKGVFEDIDLCWRARAGGWTVVYEPDALMTHAESASHEEDGSHNLHRNSFNNLRVLLLNYPGIESDEHLFLDAETLARWTEARRHLDASRTIAPDLPFQYMTMADRVLNRFNRRGEF